MLRIYDVNDQIIDTSRRSDFKDNKNNFGTKLVSKRSFEQLMDQVENQDDKTD